MFRKRKEKINKLRPKEIADREMPFDVQHNPKMEVETRLAELVKRLEKIEWQIGLGSGANRSFLTFRSFIRKLTIFEVGNLL